MLKKNACKGVNIVGISANYHDSACCVLRDGLLVAAAQEERFTRIKYDPSPPRHAFRYCLDEAKLTIADVDCVAYYENPTKKLERQIWAGALRSQLSDPFLLSATRPEQQIRELLGFDGPIEFVDHHHAHAASTFYFSGFLDAAIMTIDGVGEWATTTYGAGRKDRLHIFEEVHFPHSVGLFYSALTSYLGFAVNDGESKVMGLAPYGQPRYAEQLQRLLRLGKGGQYRLDLRYFDFSQTDRMYTDELCELLGHLPRANGTELLPFHADVASSLQVVLEDAIISKVRYLKDRVGSENLCLAGGVALNCVANGKILRNGIFRELFVQPAAGDAGGALEQLPSRIRG
jgi:carbamoyltransferase